MHPGVSRLETGGIVERDSAPASASCSLLGAAQSRSVNLFRLLQSLTWLLGTVPPAGRWGQAALWWRVPQGLYQEGKKQVSGLTYFCCPLCPETLLPSFFLRVSLLLNPLEVAVRKVCLVLLLSSLAAAAVGIAARCHREPN